MLSYLPGRSVSNSTDSSSSTDSKEKYTYTLEIKSMFKNNYAHKNKIVLDPSLPTLTRGTASRALHIIIFQKYLHDVAFM